MTNSKEASATKPVLDKEDKDEADDWYKRSREIMNGPKSNKQLN